MFVIPWWGLVGVITVLCYLTVRLVILWRRSRRLRDEVRRLEGACNGDEKQEEFKDTDMGGFEGGN
ncbi:MAG: hypothetical protein V1656_02305 [Candidatus Jorgensenbacteria bacterium]